MFKYSIVILGSAVLLGALFLFIDAGREVVIAPSGQAALSDSAPTEEDGDVKTEPDRILQADLDIENQKPLQPPPDVIKAIYLTSWGAATPSILNPAIQLIKDTELNAVVIDIKDYSGYVVYDIQNEDVIKYGAKETRISRINSLIKRLHDEGIYVIARQTVFQDPILAKARPDLALYNKLKSSSSSMSSLWYDHKGIAWMDPAAKEVWDYNIAIAKDVAERGFDEINFDYIRFASDGDLSNIGYPFFDPATQLKKTIISNFFKYLRENTQGVVISADLFGLTTVNYDDLGIGQSIEEAYKYFDYVAPMVYPSHYAKTFLGYQNPADYPYEVVNYSMASANQRLKTMIMTIDNNNDNDGDNQASSLKVISHSTVANLRPWLQHFGLGAIYDAVKIRAQIKATIDAGVTSGYMLWDPTNKYKYAREALAIE